MSLTIGLNFRASSGFVVDGTNETFVLDTDSYPTVRGGVTMGWSTAPTSSRDRDNTVDRRLAGINFGNAGTFRLDLPATGAYAIALAMGDMGSPQIQSHLKVRDNGTAVIDVGPHDTGSSGSTEFYDASNASWSHTAWPGSNVAVSKTFTSTLLTLTLETSSSNSVLTHLQVVQTGGGGTTFTQGLTASQSQAATLGRQVGAHRSSTQGQTATASRSIGAHRSAAQAQVASLLRQIRVSRVATQTQTATIALVRQFVRTLAATQGQAAAVARAIGATRSATQAQVATLGAIKVILKTLSAAQAQGVSLARAITARRTVAQGQALTMVRQIGALRSTAQASAAVVVKGTTKGLAIAQAQLATLTALKVILKTLSATQTQAAALLRQIGLVRVRNQSQVGALARQIGAVRTVVQPEGASFVKAISLTKRAAQGSTARIQKAIGWVRSIVQATAAALRTLLNPDGQPTPTVLPLMRSWTPVQALLTSSAPVVGPFTSFLPEQPTRLTWI